MEDLGIGIYKIVLITFPVNRVVYVGQSKYLSERISIHKKLLIKKKHHNSHLQNIFNKYGLSNLRWEIICNCGLSELNALEQFYIDELNPECNIIRDVLDMSNKRVFVDEPPMLDMTLPGLELDWKPLPWHRWVYGSGRHEFK